VHASPIVVTAIATIGPEGVLAGSSNAEYLKPAREGPPARMRTNLLELLDPARSRRFDAQASLAAIGCGAVLGDGNLPPSGVGLVAGTAFGNVDRTVAFVQTAVRKGPRRAAPAEFPHLVPSAPSGNASIYHGLSGPVLASSDLGASAEAAVSLACDWIDADVARSFVAGSAEPFDASVSAVLGPVCESEGAIPRSEGAGWLLVESEEAARSRSAPVSAVVRARYQVAAGEFSTARILPPSDAARALVVIGQSLGRVESVLSRSAWGNVQVRSVAERTGWHEGVGGFALAAAVALIMRKEVGEVLVVGHTAARAYLFHLTAPA
jgi:3-oxoacyl-[acyl-carrier-protein] synthase II